MGDDALDALDRDIGGWAGDYDDEDPDLDGTIIRRRRRTRRGKGNLEMTDLSEIVDALLSISEWPWFHAGDDAEDCPSHKDSGLALVDTGRTQDWPIARLCEWNTAKFIASSPVWLATVIVGWIEERAQVLEMKGWKKTETTRMALRDFNLTDEKFAELKRRLGSSLQKE